MRIGVNCFLLQPTIGGLKQYFLTLVRELLMHDQANEYVLFWFEHNAAELENLGTERWKPKAVLLQDQVQVADHLDRIDLYFCPFGALWPRPLPVPTVVTLVDIQERYYPEFFSEDDHFARDKWFPSSTRMADRVITISEFSKQSIVRHHRIPGQKVIVAYLSADERYYRSDQIAQKPDVSLPREYIFCPANFWKHKNHDRLLQSLRLLRDEHHLTIDAVFTGYEQPNGYPLAAKAQEYGLGSQIHVLGYRSVEELAYIYRHARMLVFPSLFEGFGIPLVEAMACGCPVVAAHATSIPEVVTDAGELFDPTSPCAIAEVIAKVWKDPVLRDALITRGKQRANDFSPALTAEAHLRAFGEAARGYSYRRYLWLYWVYQHYYNARLAVRWPKRFVRRVQRHLVSAGGPR